MDIISVKMLGNPTVMYNQNKVTFPYKKAEALFYYVCLNKHVRREEAMNIFWADTDEATGRKNLRDAIYKIKLSTCDTIFSPSKTYIEFSDNVNIEIDTDNLDVSNARNLYTGDFLLNFSVKNCFDFENWMIEKRNFYKDIYIKSVFEKVNELVSIGDYVNIQKYSDILIQNDPYNEKTLRYLMKIFALSEDYNTSVKLYYDMCSVLKHDLGVEPEQKTKKMYKEILELKNTFNQDQQKNNFDELKIKVENLTGYYTMYHETYPVLATEFSNRDDFSVTDVEKELSNIEKDLKNIDNLDTEYIKIKMEESYLAGRYYISKGNYNKGIEKINISIKLAEKLDNFIYLLNNYKQMIYYGIQVDNSEIMKEYIGRSMNLLEKRDIIEERGIMLRLKGLYFIKTENYKEAASNLTESINIFSSLYMFNKKYSVNISACYNYLGQMNKDLGNFKEAFDFFMKAINICNENSVLKGLEIFYSNAGQALYHMGKYDEAKKHINTSLEYFERFNSIWGRDFAECYAALIEIKNENLNLAQLHIKNAEEYANKLNNPKSIDLTEKIKKILEEK
ncbi:BTAD domain-containing putative transcriptional regulator [Sedimentibacter saalensis]|uniref:DNA-binding SARP family transcriptional activator n=1 Tax=Sedimentibacter saalensis TaxID=130788 RepID=A0A562JCC9_9FIRM|nr:BTAD domain-containing putative transcriptional regulator [Sedimentibacter saalensis]TWH80495.1 DNA-binding SARP family transcriptional activator [Sedimentibacter saalensis]